MDLESLFPTIYVFTKSPNIYNRGLRRQPILIYIMQGCAHYRPYQLY